MDTSKIWLISDLHLNHRNIIEYCNRPFSSVEEMNRELIKNWNSVVKNSDRVFCLGDFCLSGKDKVIELGNKLNGRKTLILGNHDSCSLKTYYNAGFEMVSKYSICLEYKKIILSHKPIEYIPFGFINIHGHIHNKKIKEFTDSKGYFNVSADCINFTPICLDSIIKIME